MAYLGIACILAIAYFIEWLEVRSDKKQTAKLEQTHQEMYDLVDEYFSGYEARERKAQIDAFIGAACKDNGREYKPQNIKQVTTAEERKARIKAEIDGTATDDALLVAQLRDACACGFGSFDDDADDWYYEEHTTDEKRAHYIESLIADGLSRAEAEKAADNFFEFIERL